MRGASRERPHDRGDPSSEEHSQQSLRVFGRRYGVDPKTIAKRKAQSTVSGLPTGQKELKSAALSVETRRRRLPETHSCYR
jgi:hypothetical protein